MITSKLELHALLAHLEVVFERVCRNWIKEDFMPNDQSIILRMHQFKFELKENSSNKIDLLIKGYIATEIDFDIFMEECCGIEKHGRVLVCNDTELYKSDYIEVQFTDFTSDDLISMLGYIQLKHVNIDTDFSSVFKYLAYGNTEYNFYTIIKNFTFWPNQEEGDIAIGKDSILIVMNDLIKMHELRESLIYKIPELANYITEVEKINKNEKYLNWHEMKFDYKLGLKLTDKQFLGLCHVLMKR